MSASSCNGLSVARVLTRTLFTDDATSELFKVTCLTEDDVEWDAAIEFTVVSQSCTLDFALK